jgi:hypothetical protein
MSLPLWQALGFTSKILHQAEKACHGQVKSLPSTAGSWPYPQILDQAYKACHGQVKSLPSTAGSWPYPQILDQAYQLKAKSPSSPSRVGS